MNSSIINGGSITMERPFQIEIYADVVFFLNLVMDYFILWIVSKIIKKKVSFKRLLLGAFLGALFYCLMIFIPIFRTTYNLIGIIGLPMIPLMITYKPQSLKNLIKLFILFHGTAFALGGAGIALFYYLNIGKVIQDAFQFKIENFPIVLLFVSCVLSYFFIKTIWSWIRKYTTKEGTLYRIKISFNGQQIDASALLDTGNALYDPFSQSPVIVVEFSSVKAFLPESIQKLFYDNKENDLSLLTQSIIQTPIKAKLRMIPFSSLGMPNGMLVGFRPDQVEVIEHDNTSTVLKDVVIGIYNQRLSKDNRYQALLHPDIFHNIA
ncbi:sigma-E processing peptidase SpoIIGA [Defluviitalea raffinosedens]|jgi:stage II sporulation protein GA (sporulation sigma-E factor processing peptidase)|uniref:Sigma-E processing peptidase SpoIIGA n=2 Tax=Defluviitalea raffinosedens TaxID=1450156 RepID=A0A7C8LIT3_9FIRM|nr:sigma-E processing peptidase SpoIIGA [Defluviitalea raffinosedens]